MGAFSVTFSILDVLSLVCEHATSESRVSESKNACFIRPPKALMIKLCWCSVKVIFQMSKIVVANVSRDASYQPLK